jgi:hypothetical protein
MSKKYSYVPHKVQATPKRTTWTDIISYYRGTFEIMKPVLDETLHFFRDELGSDYIFDQDLIKKHLQEENSDSYKSKARESEFARYYRNRLYNEIILYTIQSEGEDPIEVHINVITFLEELHGVFKDLAKIVSDKPNEAIYLLSAIEFLEERIFPDIKNFDKVFAQLKKFAEYYEIQRYLLCSREELSLRPRSNEVPALSPHFIDIVKMITTKFNSEYLSFPTDIIEIPVLEKKTLLDVFVANIGTTEKTVFEELLHLFGMEIESEELVKFADDKIKVLKQHGYLAEVLTEIGPKLEPRLSNETLFWIFLSNASIKRMHLSRKLINWISGVFAVIIYESILRKNMQEQNFFIRIFTDPYIEEKLIPYLMKLVCFEPMLSIDYMQIDDSPVQRKKILELLGDKIETIDILIDELKEQMISIMEEKK